jgi:hypothetical protein
LLFPGNFAPQKTGLRPPDFGSGSAIEQANDSPGPLSLHILTSL